MKKQREFYGKEALKAAFSQGYLFGLKKKEAVTTWEALAPLFDDWLENITLKTPNNTAFVLGSVRSAFMQGYLDGVASEAKGLLLWEDIKPEYNEWYQQNFSG